MGRSGCFVLVVIAFLFGCRPEDKAAREIAEIKVNLKVKRFDKAFGSATPADLGKLKEEYPYLFPARYTDSVWTAKMEDTIQIELLEELDHAFPDFRPEREELEQLYKHILYYFPGTVVPTVITVPSDVDYNNRVILADTLLLIGLDNYLGEDHRFYEGIDRYIARGMDRQYLVSDVAWAFAKKQVPYPKDRAFLARMVYYGKLLYLMDKWLPFKTEAERIGYSEEELDWARANEEPIWRYFIERDLLYSTDTKLGPRFLDPAPFSKFQLELDSESPARLGRYLGWQIVRAYMEQKKTTLSQMIDLPAAEIFKSSNYKPKK